MKSKGMKVVLSILALAISGLATAAHAQQGPQTVVKFTYKGIVIDGGQSTDAYGINNKQVIVGDYLDSAGLQHGMYFKGKNQPGPSCPGYRDTAFFAVNSSGTAVAYCNNPGARPGVRGDRPQGPCDGVIPCVMLYLNKQLIPDPNPPCLSCPYMALAINDITVGPEVGGGFQDTQGLMHGYVSNLQTGAVETLDVPGGLNSTVWGINNAGQATLQAQDAAGQTHSYLYAGGTYQNIDVPGAVLSFVHGINNNGDIVYTVEDANGGLWGVLFVQWLNQYYWFNQPDGRREATQAFGLNDEVQTRAGAKLQIVGGYTIPGSTQHYAFQANVNIKR